PPADLAAGARGLEIVDQPVDRPLDAVELVLEHPAMQLPGIVGEALAAEHVPDVLVTRADHARRVLRKNGLQERAERAGPVRRAMPLAETFQRFQEIRVPLITWHDGEVFHALPPGRRTSASSPLRPIRRLFRAPRERHARRCAARPRRYPLLRRRSP